MKHVVPLTLILLFSITIIHSQEYQEYFEASGQTSAFTLSAGETSDASSVLLPRQQIVQGDITVQFTTNKLMVNFANTNTGNAEITIYDMRGRAVRSVSGITGQVYKKSLSGLAAGIYSIAIKAKDVRHNHRFLVTK